jgi:hypothetical protein
LVTFDGDVYATGFSTVWTTAALAFAHDEDVLVAGRLGKSQLLGVSGPSAFLTIRPPRTTWSRRRWLAAVATSKPVLR